MFCAQVCATVVFCLGGRELNNFEWQPLAERSLPAVQLTLTPAQLPSHGGMVPSV